MPTRKLTYPNFAQIRIVASASRYESNMQETTTVSDNHESNIECLSEIYTMMNRAEFPLCSGLLTQQNRPVSPVLLLPESLIQLHSDYLDWEEVSKKSPWDLTSYERLVSISRSEIDGVI